MNILNLFKQSFLAKTIIILAVMLTGGGNFVWGDTVIKTINFSDSSWNGMTFSQGNTTTPDYNAANEVTFYSKSTTNQFSLSDGVLTFPNANWSSGNYILGFPVTGIVGGIITIKVYNGTTATRVKYSVKSGATSFSTSDNGSGSSPSSDDNPCSINVTNISDSKAFVYIGRYGTYDRYKTITKIEVLTPEENNLSKSSDYLLYKQSNSESVTSLIDAANLPSYISFESVTMVTNSTGNSSSISSPIDFTKIDSSKRYYRLRPSASSKIVIGGLSRVKSIRLYGNGSTYDGKINFTVTKLSGTGSDMTIGSVVYENSQETVKEYSTGDLTTLTGYDKDTYYLYTITFEKNTGSLAYFSLWGLYIEAAQSCTSVDAPADLSCSAQSKTSLTFRWTAAENASSYDVTLYSNAECTDQVATANVTTTNHEFTGLNGNTTYYCKVQSKGDGSTYCEDGNVTDAVSGTTLNKDYVLTVASNNDVYGTAAASAYSLDGGDTTKITASANTGYKFRSWTVEGTGATLSSTTDNPTTLTIGTANATVMATFSALEHYTITYNKGEYGTGSAIANDNKTEDVDFTLSSSKYTRSGYIQTGWARSEGGEKAYELGGTYTENADLSLYPYWTEQHTITYDRNGGTNYMTVTTGAGEVTLKENSFIKTGYTFLGWATSQDDADNGIVSYADKATYQLTADVTLYAVWGENYCEMKPNTSGDALTVGDVIIMQESTVLGGKMTVSATTGGLSYTTPNGLQSGAGYTATLDIELNNYMKPGSIIVLTIHALSSGLVRGYDLYSSDGNSKIASLTTTNIGSTTIQYIVKEGDGLDGTKGFKLIKANTNLIYLKSLSVIDCQPGGVIPESGWTTYSCNKALDLSTISGGTAYIATTVNNGSNNVIVKKCNNIVEAGTGLMIKGTAGDTFTINATKEASNIVETNLMVGLPHGGTAPTGSYVFGWPSGKADEYGFYYINSTEPTLGLGKAYLTSPQASNGAKLRISFDDEENTTTDIQNAKEFKQQNSEYFNLKGQRVLTPKKGLYISNGKKIINK